MSIAILNSFIEDTCVLVAVAFLFVRGPLERLLVNPVPSGIILGLLGASEAVFPNARFPYASHTLACAFAAIAIQWRAGAIAGFLAWVASIALRSPSVSVVSGIQVLITVLVVGLIPWRSKSALSYTVLAVALAQGLSILAARPFALNQASLTSPWTILANTFGVALLRLVVNDARVCSQAEFHRREAVEAKRKSAEAQLAILRSRIQPHFLYNALNSIAALCDIDARRASRATIQLGALLRESLNADFGKPHSLRREMEIVKHYTDIEIERFGPKLDLVFHLEGCENISVPTFAVQILVENAILHGVSRLKRNGTVCVTARRNKKYVYVAVSDDGVGMPPEGWKRDSPHGLNILKAQLESQFGSGGRLRIARRVSGGTLAVMRLTQEAVSVR